MAGAEQVEGGLAAFLGFVAEQPAVAQMCMIESLSATPTTAERYEDALADFVALARDTLPRDKRLPETIAETRGRRGGLDRLPADPPRRGGAG